jgi:hypothetical protein
MLLYETAQVRECVRHAEECARQAKAQTNPKFQQDFLDLERRWLRLARSYEFSERLVIVATQNTDYKLSQT